MKGVSILGSTGSIGVSTLNVIAQHRDMYSVVALAANSNVKVLAEQCLVWKPAYAVMSDAGSAQQLEQQLRKHGLDTKVLSGGAGLETVSRLAEIDYVMAAIVGAAGLLPTLAAARAGKRVLLANKEALVMSGRLFMDAIKEHHAELLPIDSEHNAIFQCMPWNHAGGLAQCGVRKIILTASGGPFRKTPLPDLQRMTPAQACAHPNWVMGRKISVDSATMMNKGLEVIEACWLFDTTPDQVQVVLHPQSVIHSLVEYVDGSVLAQLGNPDMRTPIAHALAWPGRITSGVTPLDLLAVARLDFEPPDETRYPCLRLARQAMQAGGTTTAILNAANEVAVGKFLTEHIRFTDIARVVEATLENVRGQAATTLEAILMADRQARMFAYTAIEKLAA